MPVKYLLRRRSPWKTERSSLPFSIRHTVDSSMIWVSIARTKELRSSMVLSRGMASGNIISATIMPDESGTRFMSPSSRSATHRVTRNTSSRPPMRGEPMRKRTP